MLIHRKTPVETGVVSQILTTKDDQSHRVIDDYAITDFNLMLNKLPTLLALPNLHFPYFCIFTCKHFYTMQADIPFIIYKILSIFGIPMQVFEITIPD